MDWKNIHPPMDRSPRDHKYSGHENSPKWTRPVQSSFRITPVLAMSTFQPGTRSSKEYVDPTSMPSDVPKVAELGVTSAPLKSAAFFIGAYCKEFNGVCACQMTCSCLLLRHTWRYS